jgi:hypothetical protein
VRNVADDPVQALRGLAEGCRAGQDHCIAATLM